MFLFRILVVLFILSVTLSGIQFLKLLGKSTLLLCIDFVKGHECLWLANESDNAFTVVSVKRTG